MKIEHTILYVIYACTFISLAFIPKNKLKQASIIFLFQQFATWFLGLLVVELHLIEYPVRELSNINKSSFLFEFLVFPIISIFFCIYFPYTKSFMRKFLYTSAFCTGITIPETIFERYTQLIKYIKWDWYITWLSVYAALLLSWYFYKWYFKINNK
ncbi:MULTISPECIES: CBO0543 family protein [Metabacillus]|uniref:CBO0543 family protein n=1 Tax=Metabacillus TaxID=2675233 RepID=UPI000EF5C63A|nr:CBO0543 family protein [Metabacillus litoralis]